jgi:hypothetical protein
VEGKTKEIEMKNFKEDLKHVLAGVLPTVVGFILFNIPAQAAILHGGKQWWITTVSVIIILSIVYILFKKYLEDIDIFNHLAIKAKLTCNLTHLLIGLKFMKTNSQAAMWHGMIIFIIASILIGTHIGCAIEGRENILGDE